MPLGNLTALLKNNKLHDKLFIAYNGDNNTNNYIYTSVRCNVVIYHNKTKILDKWTLNYDKWLDYSNTIAVLEYNECSKMFVCSIRSLTVISNLFDSFSCGNKKICVKYYPWKWIESRFWTQDLHYLMRR